MGNMDQLPKISLCSFVMDRPITGLQSWLKYNSFNNIYICDWFSKIPVYEKEDIGKIIQESQFKNIYVIRSLHTGIFFITKARNLAMKLMKRTEYPLSDYTLMIDSDVELIKKLTPDLFNPNKKGYCKSKEVGHLSGTSLFPTDAFWEINGYMETITFMHSDLDYYDRLNSKGYRIHKDITPYINHIDHPRDLSDRIVINKRGKQSEENKKKWIETLYMQEIESLIYYPDGRIENIKL